MDWFRFGDLVLGVWCVVSVCLTVVVWFLFGYTVCLGCLWFGLLLVVCLIGVLSLFCFIWYYVMLWYLVACLFVVFVCYFVV